VLSKEMESTPDGARMKVQRALNSLVKHLGGWKPYHEQDNQEDTAVPAATDVEQTEDTDE
jgi:hypothetical protein